MRGAVLLGGLFVSVGAAVLVATPVPATGQVVDVAGRPVPGADVREIGDLLTPSGASRSDAEGRYRLSARRWPTGAERLVVRAAGFQPALGPVGGRRSPDA